MMANNHFRKMMIATVWLITLAILSALVGGGSLGANFQRAYAQVIPTASPTPTLNFVIVDTGGRTQTETAIPLPTIITATLSIGGTRPPSSTPDPNRTSIPLPRVFTATPSEIAVERSITELEAQAQARLRLPQIQGLTLDLTPERVQMAGRIEGVGDIRVVGTLILRDDKIAYSVNEFSINDGVRTDTAELALAGRIANLVIEPLIRGVRVESFVLGEGVLTVIGFERAGYAVPTLAFGANSMVATPTPAS